MRNRCCAAWELSWSARMGDAVEWPDHLDLSAASSRLRKRSVNVCCCQRSEARRPKLSSWQMASAAASRFGKVPAGPQSTSQMYSTPHCKAKDQAEVFWATRIVSGTSNL